MDNRHGVDLILGGHDHSYYVSKGVTQWTNYDVNEPVLGSETDLGDVLVIKSGTDFRDLSEVILDLEPTREGSVRRFIIKSITGKFSTTKNRESISTYYHRVGTRHSIQPDYRSSESLKVLVNTLLASVSKTMKAPVCTSAVVLDLRSQILRTGEVRCPEVDLGRVHQ